MESCINTLYIQRLSIDWNNIEKDSYLRRIEAIRGFEELELISIQNYIKQFAFPRVTENQSGEIFSGQKVFITWQLKRNAMQI